MPRTAGASTKAVHRILFMNTETGHNWYVGPYTSLSSVRALRTRTVNEMNAELAEKGEKPAIKGVVQIGKIVRWEDDLPDER